MADNLAAPKPRSAAVFNLPSSTNTPSASSLDGGDDGGAYDDDDGAPLPFPEALPRSDFLRPDFEPAEYLSALPHRHQTLEDLRGDLRDRSSAISAELLELVNDNYTAFLSLGTDLHGGDDKVEDVRVAMLGFRRAVDDVKAGVARRRAETARLNADLAGVRSAIHRGRHMLELSDRLSLLEDRLALGSTPGADDDASSTSDEDEDEEGAVGGTSPAKLGVLADDCRCITRLMASLDQDHPFVVKQEERLMRCRNTLLLDLGNALRQARGAGTKGQDRVLKYLAIYRVIDAQDEAIKVLKKR